MSNKLRVGVIFGSRSGEHEVSIVSAQSVIRALDKEKYEVIPIGITKEGAWIAGDAALEVLKQGAGDLPYRMTFDFKSKSELLVSEGRLDDFKGTLDVVFPVVHGTNGEDGALQGLLQMLNIPYVGSGILGSALSMDKVMQKKITDHADIPSVAYRSLRISDWKGDAGELLNGLEYPIFVKPANLGSSVGISKVHATSELVSAIEYAFKYDTKIILEQGIENIREVEVAVLGNDDPEVSVPGEIVSSNEFYDYDAKYIDGASIEQIPAQLPNETVIQIQEYAKKTFIALELNGMARIDFFVAKDTLQIYLNEVNTIPGFTSISMYPKLWQASGVEYSALLDKLISLAIERSNQRSELLTSYTPKDTWHIEKK